MDRGEKTQRITAPMAAVVVEVSVRVGDVVTAGRQLVVLESMKMHHPVLAETAGTVTEVLVALDDQVTSGAVLVVLGAVASLMAPPPAIEGSPVAAPEGERADLRDVVARRTLLDDDARPTAVAKRHALGKRTVRENIAQLCDDASFEEWGGFAIAAQRGRRSVEDLIAATPADGLVAGIGRVNGAAFGVDAPGDARTRCAVVSYDYLVLAGTQGFQNHRKKDRMFELIERMDLPLVLFAEGGGGRPGDVDAPGVSSLDTRAFALFARLCGRVPLVGIGSGRCFAGNAALLACCDVIIGTRDLTLGLGGPAMIAGGGLGDYRPEQIGPIEVQSANGVVDIVVEDEVEAVEAAKKYLSYFQGPIAEWTAQDQELLRDAVPEDRMRVYDVRAAIDVLFDAGSILEVRGGWGPGMVTLLARIEGRPVGVIANDCRHLGGAIDADAAEKAARFLRLCETHGLPIISLIDTPGFMVGPEAEETGQVRRVARLFVAGANLTVPFVAIVLRKGYGLGAQAMAGGSFREPALVAAWPTGEVGGMGLEGAVRLGFRKELEAIADDGAREERLRFMVARAHDHAKALNVATYYELDDVIDPADTRKRIVHVFRSSPPATSPTGRRAGGRRGHLDTW